MHTKKLFVHTFGCKVNQYETQALHDRLRDEEGYATAASIDEADAVLINTCTVTGEADRQCRQMVRRILRKKPGLRIVITGCYALRAREEIARLFPAVTILEKDPTRQAITSFDGHSRAFVKIQDGCDAYCSYCIVPYVRPVMWSKPADEVLSEVRRLSEGGYPEIVLSGVRLGRYTDGLSTLLKKILALPGTFRVRLSSLEMGEVTEELLSLVADQREKLCPHFHLPLQSGSDAVLAAMRRPYTAEEFAERAGRIRQCIPDAAVTTDVIVGFPGETEEDFQATFQRVSSGLFSRLHVFKYSERSGTRASTMENKIPGRIMEGRAALLRELDGRLQKDFWRSFAGKERQVVIEEGGQSALTDNYIRLAVENHSNINVKGKSMCSMRIFERADRPWGSITR